MAASLRVLRIGSRGSALALAQSQHIAARLPDAELVTISSDGDRSSAPLAELGGTGVFATALRRALLDGEVDVLVHSLKDLPTEPAEGIALAAVPKRADARDALCVAAPLRTDGRSNTHAKARSLSSPRSGRTEGSEGDPFDTGASRLTQGTESLPALPEGARVGTGSPRRVAQLRATRPDLDVVDLRGNVDTRLGRLELADDDDRRLDAVILAAAGLARLDRLGSVEELLDLGRWPTAPGQGALAIETRAGEERLASKLDHRASRLAVAAERGVLAALEAGCSAPIGAHALLEDGLLFLSARVYAHDGSTWVTASHALYPEDSRDPAHEVAQRVADELVAQGATELAS